MANEIEKDIELAKVNKRVDLQMIDSKVIANFCINDSSETDNGSMGSYTNYSKAFDDFESFSSYAKLFFE